MKKLILTIAIVLGISSGTSFGQVWQVNKYELEGGVNYTSYYGDYNGGLFRHQNLLDEFDLGNSNYGFNIGFRTKINEKVARKVAFSFGSINIAESTSIKGNSLSIKYYEPSIQWEYYLREESKSVRDLGKRYGKQYYNHLAIYTYGGAALSFSDANLVKEERVDIEETICPVLKGGLGVKVRFADAWAVGADFGPTVVLIDNFDAISQGISKDVYFNSSLRVIYVFKNDRMTGQIIF